MKNPIEEANKIYQEIIDLIWSIFPEDGLEAHFDAQIFELSEGYTFYWFDKNGNECWNKMGENPSEILKEIIEQLKLLQQNDIFKKERWTHCKIVVSDDYKLTIKFAYISLDNSWPGLYMKGISDWSYEEAESHGVSKKDWEKQIKIANQMKENIESTEKLDSTNPQKVKDGCANEQYDEFLKKILSGE